MIGFSSGAPVTTDPESAMTLARVVLGSLMVVTALWYRTWSRITECAPGELKRRIGDMLARLE